MHVVDDDDDDQVLGVHVMFVRLITKCTTVLDVFAGFFDVHVVEHDNVAFVKLHVVEVLQPLDAFFVELLCIPIDLGHKPIQTRLIQMRSAVRWSFR